jgi:hypothetical protein
MIASAALLALFLALSPAVGVDASHYLPHPGDGFSYSETITVDNGSGNYTGYTETSLVTGNESVDSVDPNGTVNATYAYAVSYSNNSGGSERWTSGGSFTFSDSTFHYLRGTDNQTGYSNPYVWFYMNNALGNGSTFYILNTGMSVVSTSYPYYLHSAAAEYVKTIFAEGNGSYYRNDVYGKFTATYNWKAYFDPATGYVVGYRYSELDRDAAGTGFAYSDVLGVTHTTYPLTTTPAPGSSTSMTGGTIPVVAIALAVVVVVIIAIVIAAILHRSRHRSRLPTHSAPGPPAGYSPGPFLAPPPPIHLTPSGQPPVQQIVIQETVKVNCRYCGSLIDSTVEKCPFCGATRT